MFWLLKGATRRPSCRKMRHSAVASRLLPAPDILSLIHILASMGRKGGSNVAAAICNALLYTAMDALDPARRGWQG